MKIFQYGHLLYFQRSYHSSHTLLRVSVSKSNYLIYQCLCLKRRTVAVSAHVCVFLCAFVSVHWQEWVDVGVLCQARHRHTTGMWNCSVYMYTTRSTEQTYTLGINTIFSINNFSCYPEAANKYYFWTMSIYNLITSS